MHSLDQLLEQAKLWPELPRKNGIDIHSWQLLIDALLADSLTRQATQLHLQATRYDSCIRYRIHGRMVRRAVVSHQIHQSLQYAIRAFTDMDICEQRRPQSCSRKSFSSESGERQFSVETVPTSHVNALVIHWLVPHKLRTISESGLEAPQLKAMEKALSHSHGFLMNFQSASLGASVVLHLHEQGRQPVWITLDGFVYPALEKLGVEQRIYPPANDHRDPNWLEKQFQNNTDCMVALVGIHAVKDILQAVEKGAFIGGCFGRQLSMAPEFFQMWQVDPVQFVELIIGSAEQKIVRSNCTACLEEYQPSVSEVDALRIRCSHPERLVFAKSRGCEACRNWTSRKQTAVHEIMLTETVRDLILEGRDYKVIRQQLVARGAMTFYESLIRKVIRREIPSWVAFSMQPRDGWERDRIIDIELED